MELTLPQAPEMVLRPTRPQDHALLREIYADAIESQAGSLYSPKQVNAWSALAWLPGVLDRSLDEGHGWISDESEAFAVRYPEARLALLYCRGRSAGRGHGSALLKRIEQDALEQGVDRLTTEASAMSRPFLLRRGWRLIGPELITIGGVPFERYQMEKLLRHARS